MRKLRRAGIAFILTSIMILSIFAVLPAATAAPGYTWRDNEYPLQPQSGTALRFKMLTVDILEAQLPTLKYYANLGVFSNDFIVSYMKIKEFMYKSTDPDLWWFQNEMILYSYMYGNYPGDNSKPNPQSAISQGKKIFQDEFIVIVELNNQIQKLTADWEDATGITKLILNSMINAMKQIRNQLVISDMAMSYSLLDIANSAVDAIENSNGKVDLSAVGGPSDFSLEKQSQVLKWTGQANDDFDGGVEGLSLSTSFVRSKLDSNQQFLIVISTGLDATAYSGAMKAFEKALSKSGHAIGESGGMDFCMNSFAFILPAAIGIVLCFGGLATRRKKKQ